MFDEDNMIESGQSKIDDVYNATCIFCQTNAARVFISCLTLDNVLGFTSIYCVLRI